ncbi:MAG: hypothetical protein IT380_04785, partial [Myxococcales bacterium]|nr:hypothetical protein [Myxococcales bacterium]
MLPPVRDDEPDLRVEAFGFQPALLVDLLPDEDFACEEEDFEDVGFVVAFGRLLIRVK